MKKLKPEDKNNQGVAVYINAPLIFRVGHGMKTIVPGVFAIQGDEYHDCEQIFSISHDIEAISKL